MEVSLRKKKKKEEEGKGQASRGLCLLLAVRLAPRDVPGLDLQREFPQGLLGQVVAEVVEEADDVLVPLQLIMPEQTSKVRLMQARHTAHQRWRWQAMFERVTIFNETLENHE